MTAPWCTRCRALAPIVAAVGDEFAASVTLTHLDAGDESAASLVTELEVKGVPTLIARRSGAEIGRIVGTTDADTVRALFASAAGGSAPPTRTVARADRVLRAVAGAVLLAAGVALGPQWVLVALGIILLLWAALIS
ncbi:MAG: hypothetical protein KDB21_20685 [Acidimicrobiales bacterium]|nr:hypothetical protein [Acidimicrobiales bacterium]